MKAKDYKGIVDYIEKKVDKQDLDDWLVVD